MDYTPNGWVEEKDSDSFPIDSMSHEDISMSHYQLFGVDSTDIYNPWNASGQLYGGLRFPDLLGVATELNYTDTVPTEDYYVIDGNFGQAVPRAFSDYSGDTMIETPSLVPSTPSSAFTDTSFQDIEMNENAPLVPPPYPQSGTGAVYSQNHQDTSSEISSISSIPDAPALGLVTVDQNHDYVCVAHTQIDPRIIEQKILVLYDPIKSKKVFKCRLCSKAYTNRANLENHLYTKHYGIRHPWACLTCVGVGFSSQTSARRHKKNAHTARTTCPKCGKSFSRADYLKGYHKKACKVPRKRKSGSKAY